MADPWGNDDSNSFGVAPAAPDPNDPNWSWNYSWLNPYGEFILNIPNTMPGPLSPQSINGSPLLYSNPQAYFAARDAGNSLAGGSDTISGVGQPSDNWAAPIADAIRGSSDFGSDTMTGGGDGNDLAGDAGSDPSIPDQFGHPNPLPPPDPAYRGELTQDADRFLKSLGDKLGVGSIIAALLGPELPPPADALAEGGAAASRVTSRMLRNNFIRGPMAHFYGNSAFDQMANAIQDANNALGNQYLNDAGGMPR